MTSSRLRELSRLASPAPWREAGRPARLVAADGIDILAYGDEVGPFFYRPDDEDLVVALRNDAEKYADLRDAGRALAARLHEMYLGAETREKLSTFVAALDALDGSAP